MTQDNHEPAGDLADDTTAKVPPADPAGPPPPGAGFPPPGGFPPPPPPPPPPGAGFPPPGGFPPPPPGTSGWATRYGLVRPTKGRGRVLAGVCAAIGRATNTDPVLWRVLIAVLSLVGGIGVLVYLIGWLFIPAEGDTGSPVEALFGRGRSSTSPIVVVIVGIAAFLGGSSLLFSRSEHLLLLIGLILAAVLLINRSVGNRSGSAPVPPVPYAPPAEPVDPSGYQPPFAPYGPYASTPYPYPGPVTAPAPVKPVRPPSRLGRVTFSLILLGLGVVGLVDVIGHGAIPFAGYVAVALAMVGVGLVLGAWFGRARGLIALGIVLSLLLGIATAAEHARPVRGSAGDVTWQPASIAALSDSYEHGFGNARLDLSQVDFTGQDKHILIRLNAGDLRVVVPPKVDVEVNAKVGAGNANVFDSSWDGVNTPRRTVVNTDTDGPGGGHLTLDIQLAVGDLEVTR